MNIRANYLAAAIVLLGSTFAISAANFAISTSVNAQEYELDELAIVIARDTSRAEAAFRADGSFKAKLYLALLLGTLKNDEQASGDEVSAILEDLSSSVRALGDGQPFFAFFEQVENPPNPYDGTVGKLVEWIRYLSVASDSRIGLMDSSLIISCDLIVKNKSLLRISDPAFGSSMDSYFPHTDCYQYRELLPDSLTDYAVFIDRFSGGYGDSGSFRFAYDRWNGQVLDMIVLFPGELPNPPISQPCLYPLEKWAVLSPWNWRQFTTSKRLYATAHIELANFYAKYYARDESQARRFASAALWTRSFEAHWEGVECLNESLRHAILSGVPTTDIIDGLQSGKFHIDEWADGVTRDVQYYVDARTYVDNYAGGPEPILHFAALRPELLSYLLSNYTFTRQNNSFWKTPLMTAAQYNVARSVELLLDAGANPNARTVTRWLEHGERSPLMYAAANASLEVIELLLRAGAKTELADTQGKVAIDYLVGNGPVPQNPVLTANDLERAATMLRITPE